MDMRQLVEKVRVTADCSVRPPVGIAAVRPGEVLPEDVRRFYELCGGLTLYESEAYSVRIVAPHEFVPVDTVLLAEVLDEAIASGEYNETTVSRAWYIVADLNNMDYVVIDCSEDPRRVGRCYAAMWDMYIARSGAPIVARSLAELLEKFLENRGQRWYFLTTTGFASYGDGYDTVL